VRSLSGRWRPGRPFTLQLPAPANPMCGFFPSANRSPITGPGTRSPVRQRRVVGRGMRIRRMGRIRRIAPGPGRALAQRPKRRGGRPPRDATVPNGSSPHLFRSLRDQLTLATDDPPDPSHPPDPHTPFGCRPVTGSGRATVGPARQVQRHPQPCRGKPGTSAQLITSPARQPPTTARSRSARLRARAVAIVPDDSGAGRQGPSGYAP
jgi:hypothetical protein